MKWYKLILLCFFKMTHLTAASISFDDLQQATIPMLSAPSFFQTEDGTHLAYYSFFPKKIPVASLIFIHGGGAYSGAGYAMLADTMRTNNNIAVYLLDLRGHGNSQGARGHTPKPERLWHDLKEFVYYIKKKQQKTPLFLGGHSSGAGLVLNYSSWAKKASVDGYLFLSPQFGYKSKTNRNLGTKPASSFAKVRPWVFALSEITGEKLFGSWTAVIFNYPKEIIKNNPLLITKITRNMAVGLTPDDPQTQFSIIDKPFSIIIGQNDELFSPKAVINYQKFVSSQIKSVTHIIPNTNHLSILLNAGELLGENMIQLMDKAK